MTDPTAMAYDVAQPPGSPHERLVFGHPRGLIVLFLTETWAHFSYFGMQALLVFYMTKQLDFSQPAASAVYGLYGGVAYFTPFIGGMIADQLIGQRRSVVIGGLLMAVGHFTLAFESLFFPGLALVGLGNGFFVPATTTQVGHLYQPGDPRRDRAYSIYYMGINIGAFAAPLVCGTLGELFGWHYGFAAAGIGMIIGLVIYLTNQKTLGPEPRRLRIESGAAKTPIGAIGWKAIRTLIGVALIIVIFRIGYEQTGNTIALWADRNTDRQFGSMTIPATWFQSINPFLIVTLTPLLAIWWSRQARRGAEWTNLTKMSMGCAIAGTGFLVMIGAAADFAATGSASSYWLVGYFVLLTVGELLVLPVGLSLFSKVSPVQAASAMIGVWYLAKFAGSLAAGWLGTLWETILPATFFSIGASAAFIAAASLALLGRFLRGSEVLDPPQASSRL